MAEWTKRLKRFCSMKLKVIRVVTASYVVPWHLSNTLKRMTQDFEVWVVGQGVSIHKDSYPEIRFVDIDINRKTSPLADGFALFALCKLFLACKPDIVHSIMPKAGLLTAIAGFICRVPVRIHTFTGQTWVAQEGLSRHFYYLLDRLTNKLNTICLTDSPSQSAFLCDHGIFHRGKPLPVLSQGSLSGVDVARFNLAAHVQDAEQLRASLGIGRENFVFAYIARKTCAKGAVDILKAFADISDNFAGAILLFVGPDEDGEMAQLRKSNPELFNKVIDVGHVSNHEVYLAVSNVLCLPSYREGFGSIVIDAAAMGIPAIGSRIPGLTDSIADGQTGLLFQAGDVAALASLMRACIEQPELCKAMGEKARIRVEELFTADKLYASLKQFYLDCVLSNPKSPKQLG
jgi:glycosyltransferase involved in cell wall biosynthesis